MTNEGSKLNADIIACASDLREHSEAATRLAAFHRERHEYALAENYDRRAEALLCAAAIAETRGLSS